MLYYLGRHVYYRKRADSIARANRSQKKLRSLAEKNGTKLPMDTLALLQQYSSLLPKDSSQLKQKGMLAAEKIATSQLSKVQQQELEDLKNKYGAESAEVKKYTSAFQLKDSTQRKEFKRMALKTAQQQTMKNLPPDQRKQLEQIQKEYGPYSKEVSGYLGFLQDSVKLADTLKVIALKRAEMEAQNFAEQQLSAAAGGELGHMKEMQGELDKMKNTPQEYQKKLEEFKDPKRIEATAKAQQEALEKFAAQADKVKGLLDKMSKLKGKYSSLLNSNDLSTGIKAKSLEGRPLRERWVIGGNFNIASTAPLMIDLSPQFGYRIDKKFQIGIGAVYRAKFVDSVKVSNSISPEHYGYSAFSSYGLLLNFFAYAEFERATSIVKAGAAAGQTQPVGDPQSRQWVNSLLIGIGRKFTVHPKVGGSVLLLWNPLHVNGKSPYHDAFVVKTGFNLSELGLMKK